MGHVPEAALGPPDVIGVPQWAEGASYRPQRGSARPEGTATRLKGTTTLVHRVRKDPTGLWSEYGHESCAM